jgi:HNH endonuclease
VSSHDEIADFTSKQKKKIFERDGYRCVMCGAGLADGTEIRANYIRPKHEGGEATFENGQTLCAHHSFEQQQLNRTDSGKKMFIHLNKLAKQQGDKEMMDFCEDVLETFEKHGINGHIEWKR